MAVKTNYEKNGKKYFRITRTIGKKADGTPIKKEFYGNSKSEAEEKANNYINKLKTGLELDFDSVTLNDLIKRWLFDVLFVSENIKPSTFQRYEGIYRNYIKESKIASLKLYQIKSINIQIYYNELFKNGKKTTQIKELNKVLKCFFNYALKENYIQKNPCTSIEIPGNKTDKMKNREVEILNEKELKILIKNLEDHKFKLLFLMALGTGLRQGELLALDWEDINFSDNTVSVSKSVKRVYEYKNENEKRLVYKFQSPKSIKSIRTIPIPNNIIVLLKKEKNKTGLIFNDNNNILSAKIVYYEWKKLLKQSNLKNMKFHALRHTYASKLLENGVDVKTVSDLLGHSDITITQIYLHSSDKLKQTAINKIDYLFD